MDNKLFPTGIAGIDRTNIDAGLRAHMQSIYNYMAAGLAVTGAIAWLFAHTSLIELMFTPLRWVIAFAPLGILFFMNMRMQTMKASTLKTMFWTFCALMGMSLSALFFVYTGDSIARAFFITGATFGCMSLWGYTSKRDLSGMGAFMAMGVIGLIIASLVNLFLMSPMLYWVISVVGVAIFAGLTAFDTQTLKEMYSENWGTDANNKVAIMGAVKLYLDFLNMFVFLVQLTGVMRRN